MNTSQAVADMQELERMSLHDTSLNSLAIDFENRQLILLVGIYNEDTHREDGLRLAFENINTLHMDAFSLADANFYSLEIYSHSITHKSADRAIKFMILTGHGLKSAEISFAFTSVKITRIPSISAN